MKLEESLSFNDVADSIPQTSQKYYVSLQILRIFQIKFSLENFMQLPLDGVYLFCKNAFAKYVQYRQKYVNNLGIMLKIHSLTGTPQNLDFSENF